MSTTATRLPQAEARRLADELIALLRGSCERLEVAGSLRRGAATIGDLELVAVPLLVRAVDLFGEPEGDWRDLLSERVDELGEEGVLGLRLDRNGRPRYGARYKALLYEGVAVDLFAVLAPAQWGVIFLIRTGPADFGHRLITPRRQGGWLPDYLRVKDGALWHEDGSMVETATEEAVFEAIGRPWIPPEARR
jgi:DNA polymerase (family 10)